MSDAASLFLQHCGRERGGGSLYLPDWTLADWQALLGAARPVALAAGAALMREGESDRALYFVVSGALEVNVSTGPGAALGHLVRQRAGSVLGEVAFFDGKGRSATVWAIDATQLLRLDHDGFRAFAAARPDRANELLFGLGRVLAQRLRQGEERRRSQSSYY